MIRTAILLARSSPLSVLFLSAAVLTIVTVVSDTPEDASDSAPPLAAGLAPVPKPRAPAGPGEGPAATRIALFDPERRPETIAGSIDDLRGIAAPQPPPANLTISGVLIDSRSAKVMLAVAGTAAAWSPVGAEVGGWRVASITPEGAVLEHDGRSLTLRVADRLAARKEGHALPDGGPPPPGPGPEGGPPQGFPSDALVPPDAIRVQHP